MLLILIYRKTTPTRRRMSVNSINITPYQGCEKGRRPGHFHLLIIRRNLKQ